MKMQTLPILFTALLLPFTATSFAKDVNKVSGNIRYHADEDNQTGNYSVKDWPKSCANFSKIRAAAIADAIKRCEADANGRQCTRGDNDKLECRNIRGITCRADKVGQNSVNPDILSELDLADMEKYPNSSAEPDAHYFPFQFSTEDWYKKNCASAKLLMLSNTSEALSKSIGALEQINAGIGKQNQGSVKIDNGMTKPVIPRGEKSGNASDNNIVKDLRNAE